MRIKLPNRRPGDIFKLIWNGTTFHCMTGLYPDNSIGEVFVKGGKDGSDLTLLLDDAFVLVSILLQYGVELDSLWKSLGRLSDTVTGEPSDRPASLIGAVIKELAMEQQDRSKVERDPVESDRRVPRYD